MKITQALNPSQNAIHSVILSDGSEITVAKQLSNGEWLAPLTFSQSFAQNLQIDMGFWILRVIARYIQIENRLKRILRCGDDRKKLVFIRTVMGEVLKLDPPSLFKWRNGRLCAEEPTLAAPCSVFEIGTIERTKATQ